MLHGPKWVSRLGVPGKGKGKCKGKGKGKGKSKGKGQGTKQGARQPSEARAYGRHAVLKGVTQVGKNLQGSTSTCGAVGRAGGDCERDGQDVPVCVCVCVSGPVVSLCVCVVCVWCGVCVCMCCCWWWGAGGGPVVSLLNQLILGATAVLCHRLLLCRRDALPRGGRAAVGEPVGVAIAWGCYKLAP